MTRPVNPLLAQKWLARAAVTLAFSVSVILAGSLETAQTLLGSGNPSAAEAILRNLLKQNPADAQAWNLMGAAHAQLRRFSEAESDFLAALKLKPRAAPVLLNLGRLYKIDTRDPRNVQKSIRAYQDVLDIDPANPEAHHELGVLLHWSGRFEDSLRHLDRLPEADRDRRSVLALKCADNLALGRRAAGMQFAQHLLADPDVEEADVLAVLPAVEAHDPASAAVILQALADRRLAGPATLARLASLREKTGAPAGAGAKDALERQFQANPSAPGPLLALARMAWEQKDYEGTLSYLAHARDLDPKDPAIHFLFGLAANELKLPAEARDSVRKAVELAPDNPYYNYALGVLQLQWTEKDAAIPYLQKYVGARPDDPRGHMALGVAFLHAFRLDEAQREIEPVAADPGLRGGAEFLLGRIAAQRDDHARAAAHFRRAADIDPGSADARAHLAGALVNTGDLDGAARAIDSALAIDADNYVANYTLMQLYRLRKQDDRVKAQVARVKQLAQKKDEDLRFLQRSLEIRPN